MGACCQIDELVVVDAAGALIIHSATRNSVSEGATFGNAEFISAAPDESIAARTFCDIVIDWGGIRHR